MWGMGMIKVIGLMVAVVCVAMSSGCGNSDPEPLTKAEYTKQAKVICHQGEQEKEEAINKAILRYQEGEKNATPELQEKAVLEVLVPFERTTERLAELEPPASQQKQVDRMLDERERAVHVMRSSNPKKALQNSGPILKAAKVTESMGLGRCDF